MINHSGILPAAAVKALMAANPSAFVKDFDDVLGIPDVYTLDYPLFANNQKKKFTRAGVAYILKKYANAARTLNLAIPEKVTPHMLRHTKAMHLLQADVNIIYIRDILGHVDVATTNVYARADTKMKRAALEKGAVTDLPDSIPPWAKDQDLLHWLKNFGKDV